VSGLEVVGVSVSYGAKTAVDQVDLEISDAGVLALLGPSGCGKSTLLRAVAGLEPITAGRISFDGQDLAGVPVHRRRFGLMFQDGVLFPHRTVAGNVRYGLERRQFDRQAIQNRVAELLELVGLAGYGPRAVGTLSGGEQQRVALARSLAPRPRLLLLDEPLAALDRALRDRLLPDLREVLRATGTAGLFVTHDQGEAFSVADVVAVMNDGRIRQTGSPAEVFGRPADAWVAGFVGYTSVLPQAALTRLGAGPGEVVATEPGELVALRPAALQVHSAGTASGRVLTVAPGAERTGLTVDVDGVGEVHAVSDDLAMPGDVVTLRFDPRFAAPVPN